MSIGWWIAQRFRDTQKHSNLDMSLHKTPMESQICLGKQPEWRCSCQDQPPGMKSWYHLFFMKRSEARRWVLRARALEHQSQQSRVSEFDTSCLRDTLHFCWLFSPHSSIQDCLIQKTLFMRLCNQSLATKTPPENAGRGLHWRWFLQTLSY